MEGRWLRLTRFSKLRECRRQHQLVQVNAPINAPITPPPPPRSSFGSHPPQPNVLPQFGTSEIPRAPRSEESAVPPPPPSSLSCESLGPPPPPSQTPPPPPLKAVSLPSPQNLLRNDSAQHILQQIKNEGPRNAIPRNWERIKALHEEEAFTVQDIAWLFDRCRSVTSLRTATLNRPISDSPEEASIALGTLIVQLFTNFICHRIPELDPSEITCFIEALTSPALPMDEFWLFMMAKQIQDTSDKFSPNQIVTIARRYASKSLEDEEFFDALSSTVHRRLAEFSLHQLAHFLFSCARVRFLHQALCSAAFPLFQDEHSVSALDGATLGAAITAAAMLDWRTFWSLPCCKLLASREDHLHAAQDSADLAMGLTLASAYMHSSAGARLLLPVLLHHFSASLPKANRSKKEVAMLQRRVMLIGLCAAFGVPTRKAWDLPQLRTVEATFTKLQSYLDRAGYRANSWEPESSRLHLEVVAILNLLEVEHELEYLQAPFQLDIMITPQQFKAVRWR